MKIEIQKVEWCNLTPTDKHFTLFLSKCHDINYTEQLLDYLTPFVSHWYSRWMCIILLHSFTCILFLATSDEVLSVCVCVCVAQYYVFSCFNFSPNRNMCAIIFFSIFRTYIFSIVVIYAHCVRNITFSIFENKDFNVTNIYYTIQIIKRNSYYVINGFQRKWRDNLRTQPFFVSSFLFFSFVPF